MTKGNALAVRNDAGDIVEYHWVGDLAKRIVEIEQELTGAITEGLDAQEFTCATLLRDTPLRRSGYLDSLPCVPMYAVPHGPQAEGHDVGERWILSTAACFHVLSAVSGAGLRPASLLTAYTCGAVCHRAEGGPDDAVLRLASFRMRELVLVGSEEPVLEQAEQAFMRLHDHLAQRLRKVRVADAADVFYGANAGALRRFQSVKRVKQELLTPWSINHEYAVASWNKHGDRLMTSFGGAEPAADLPHSACVAFGVERLAVALLADATEMLPQEFLAAVRIG
ncbi:MULTISPECIES: hypothetical protein [unclassified Micromonospora]|uniref:hypothetical protein n=1 Tax=unclassified Micromonospora TaxID=2617518 RepID=UPI003A88E552